MAGATKQQRSVSLSIDGKDRGVWDTMTGGAVDSDDNKYKEGGMVPEVSLGTSSTVTNIILGRLYRLERDHGWASNTAPRVGKADCVVKDQPLDADGNPFGRPRVFRGKLKTITYPDADSNASDPSVVMVEITPSGTVS